MDEMLKPCPFCGGKAVLKDGHIYCDETIIVTCTLCHVRTVPVFINHPSMTRNGLDESTRYTVEQAREKACELWNKRTTPDYIKQIGSVNACTEVQSKWGKNDA